MKHLRKVKFNRAVSMKSPGLISKTIQKPHKPPRLRSLALAVALSFSVSVPNLVQAATYNVLNTNDDGLGSLRFAVSNANDLTPNQADTIEFKIPSGSVINLLSEIEITDSLTIKGPIDGDAGSIVLDGGRTNRHINAGGFQTITNKSITLENITLQNGFFDGTGLAPSNSNSYGGGSIFVINAGLTLNHVKVSGNSTIGDDIGAGGIFFKVGDITINNSIISNNSTAGSNADGGGLNIVTGGITLIKSSISGNSTTGLGSNGGGFRLVNRTTHTLTESTISDNSAKGRGGGMFVDTYGDLTLTQTTVSSNEGGGLYVINGTTTLIQSTIVNNSAVSGAGGLTTKMDTSHRNVTTINTILSGNAGPEGNFEDTAVTPLGLLKATNSLFGDPATEITDPTSSANIYSDIPDLGPLQHNGGLTQTHKPKITSQVINTGDNTETTAFSNDQRDAGFPRIIDAVVDIGAVELQNISASSAVPLNPNEVVTRRDMAREILKAYEGNEDYIPLDPNNNDEPYQVTGTYDDVGVGDVNAVFIEEFERRGWTEGCDTNKFCPDMVVTREQMARVFMTTFYSGSTPPSPS